MHKKSPNGNDKHTTLQSNRIAEFRLNNKEQQLRTQFAYFSRRVVVNTELARFSELNTQCSLITLKEKCYAWGKQCAKRKREIKNEMLQQQHLTVHGIALHVRGDGGKTLRERETEGGGERSQHTSFADKIDDFPKRFSLHVFRSIVSSFRRTRIFLLCSFNCFFTMVLLFQTAHTYSCNCTLFVYFALDWKCFYSYFNFFFLVERDCFTTTMWCDSATKTKKKMNLKYFTYKHVHTHWDWFLLILQTDIYLFTLGFSVSINLLLFFYYVESRRPTIFIHSILFYFEHASDCCLRSRISE